MDIDNNDTYKYIILKSLYRIAMKNYNDNKPVVLDECNIINSIIQKQITNKNTINLTIGDNTIGFILNIPYTKSNKDRYTDTNNNPYIGPRLYSLYNTKISIDKICYTVHILYNMKNNYTEVILEDNNNNHILSYIDTKNTLINNNILDNLLQEYSKQESIDEIIPNISNNFNFKELVLGTSLILKISKDKERNIYKHYDIEYNDNANILDVYITDTEYTHIVEMFPVIKDSVLYPYIYNLRLLDKYNTDPNYKGISLFIGKVLMNNLNTPYIKYGNLNKQYLSLMKI